jgi:hypothetical protein
MQKYLPILKKLWHPGLILTAIFLILLIIEAYLLYYKVYANLSTGIEALPVPSSNIVRLDINSYNKTLELLDSLKAFTGSTADVDNPFN